MSDEQRKQEDEVFGQELSMDDLDAAAGGHNVSGDDDCIQHWGRLIYGGKGFPNCAATVEDGSSCVSNDACRGQAIKYVDITGQGPTECEKAWR